MTSFATRDSIAVYERVHNAFLRAICPGGILSGGTNAEGHGPYEALIVPREIALRAYSLTPFLLLGATPHSTAAKSATSAATALSPSSPRREDAESEDTNAINAAVTARLKHLTPQQHAQIQRLLQSLLRYHLIHFDFSGTSRFTTANDDRGEFAETLDRVRRFGRLGAATVVSDMDALYSVSGISNYTTDGRALHSSLTAAHFLLPETLNTNNKDVNSNGATAAAMAGNAHNFYKYHPATLQIYLVDELLMDSQELQHLTDQLDRVIPSAQSQYKEQTHDPPQRKVKSASNPPPPPSVPPAVAPAAAAAAAAAALRVNGVAVVAGSGSNTFEDEDDIVVEEDLSVYVSKSTRRDQLHRQQQQPHVCDERPVMDRRMSGGSNNSSRKNKALSAGNTVYSSGESSPVGVAKSAPSFAAATSHASPNPLSSQPVPQPPHHHSPRGTENEVVPHANLLNHEYSKESIKDYRRAVAADNEIYYGVFERLMETRECFPVVKLVSDFVAAAQMRGRGFRDNRSYIIFTAAVRDAIARIPSLANSSEKRTILYEGVEKYVTSKLYFLFFNVDERERGMNSLLQEKFCRVERLTARQLDALEEVERHHVWGQAMFELDGMNFFKSPREKLRCAMRASELLSLAVGDILTASQRRAHAEAAKASSPPNCAAGVAGASSEPVTPYATTVREEGDLAATTNTAKPANANATAAGDNIAAGPPLLAFGADEFLPCFMLLVLRAQPYNYYQNLQYIDKFRSQDLLSAEESYCLANVMSACEFWISCNDEGGLESRVPTDRVTSPPTATPTTAAFPAPNRHTAAGIASVTRGTGGLTRGELVTAKALAPGGTRKEVMISQGTVIAAPPPPVMQREDLLPSVRQASSIPVARSRLQTITVGAAPPNKAAPSAPATAEKGPNIMDKLFGWTRTEGGDESKDGDGSGFPLYLFTRQGGSQGASAEPAGLAGTATVPPVERKSTAYRLLVQQRKRYEDLSEGEIRAIVEEARLNASPAQKP